MLCLQQALGAAQAVGGHCPTMRNHTHPYSDGSKVDRGAGKRSQLEAEGATTMLAAHTLEDARIATAAAGQRLRPIKRK